MDDKLLKSLEQLETIMKNFKASIKTLKPTLSLPKVPGSSTAAPKIPAPAPASKKSSTKVGEQAAHAQLQKPKIKIAANGQWKL